MFVLNFTTSDAMRNDIISFTERNALEHRVKARIAKTQKAKAINEAKAESYEFIVTFLKELKIET